MVMEELRDSFDELESGVTEDMIFNLHEDIINVAIFNAIREENPEYMPTDDCVTPEQCYVVAEQQTFEDFDIMLRVVGAWVDFEQDIFNLNVFLEVELDDGFTYKTIVSTEFKFTDVPGKYVLEFEELSIGNLPLPASALSGLLNAIETNAEDLDFDALNDDIEFGEVDLEEFSFTIQKSEIVEKIGEDQPSAENDLVKEVVSIIFDQELLTFEFVEEEFVVSGRLSKFQSEDVTDIPSYLYDLHTVDAQTGEVGAFDPMALDEDFLADLFTEYVFNYALVPDSGFVINEETFNKMIYHNAAGFEDQRTIQELDLGDGNIEEIEIGLKGIWFEITPEAIYANALIRVASVDSSLVITASKVETESTDTELVFEFTEISFGKDDGETANEYLEIVDLDVFKQMFAELGDIEFGEFDENGTLTISAARLSALMQDGSQEDTVNVTGIAIVQDAIVLEIEPADENLAQVLEDFGNALQTVVESEELLDDLEALLDTETEGPEQEVFEAVQDLQETLANNEVPDAEQVTELFDNFEDLDQETQEEFLETIGDLIDPSVLENYEDLFDQEQQ
jgi:hypothetical protein